MSAAIKPKRYTAVALGVLVLLVFAAVLWSDHEKQLNEMFDPRGASGKNHPLTKTLLEMDDRLVKSLGISVDMKVTKEQQEQGANSIAVRSVRPGSPADHAGFRAGDRIIGCQGQPIQGMPTTLPVLLLQFLARDIEDGEAQFRVVRDNQAFSLTAHDIPSVEIPEGAPDVPGALGPPVVLPVDGYDMGIQSVPGLRRTIVQVIQVAADGAADKAGLRDYDHIRSVNGKSFGAPLDLIKILVAKKAGERTVLGISRGQDKLTVSLVRSKPTGKPMTPQMPGTGMPGMGMPGTGAPPGG